MPKRVTKGNLWGFIQSRPYASVADIRRLFVMEVDGAAALPTSEGACYIGLPREAADLIRQLWLEGRIILDLNPDVKARVVQGVYPARVPIRQGAGGAAGATAGGKSAPKRAGQSRAARPATAAAPAPSDDANGQSGQTNQPESKTASKRRRRRNRRASGQTSGQDAPGGGQPLGEAQVRPGPAAALAAVAGGE